MSRPLHYIHNGVNWLGRNSAPYRCGAQAATDMATTNPAAVTCTDCVELMGKGVSKVSHPDQSREAVRRRWTLEVVAGETNLGFADWANAEGIEGSAPCRHTPPRMEDENGLTDGVFLFHGTHSDLGGVMEVVPMATGNVEFTISATDEHQEGLVFSLSHLDRADLIRALLHDFHYSPERGGPNGEPND